MTPTLQSLKNLQNWQHNIRNNIPPQYYEGEIVLARIRHDYTAMYDEYVFWMAHLASTQFLDTIPYQLKTLTLSDVEFLLKVRTQILRNRKNVEQEKVRAKQRAALEKLKKTLQ